jgi:hypothetical protein
MCCCHVVSKVLDVQGMRLSCSLLEFMCSELVYHSVTSGHTISTLSECYVKTFVSSN